MTVSVGASVLDSVWPSTSDHGAGVVNSVSREMLVVIASELVVDMPFDSGGDRVCSDIGASVVGSITSLILGSKVGSGVNASVLDSMGSLMLISTVDSGHGAG